MDIKDIPVGRSACRRTNEGTWTVTVISEDKCLSDYTSSCRKYGGCAEVNRSDIIKGGRLASRYIQSGYNLCDPLIRLR